MGSEQTGRLHSKRKKKCSENVSPRSSKQRKIKASPHKPLFYLLKGWFIVYIHHYAKTTKKKNDRIRSPYNLF